MKILGSVFLLICMQMPVFAHSVSPLSEMPERNKMPARNAAAEARIEVLQNRLEEIKAMDLKQLEKAEKSEVKKELREIRKELRAYNASGIYISIGGLLIIVLLLILLL